VGDTNVDVDWFTNINKDLLHVSNKVMAWPKIKTLEEAFQY
jgi:hypothetical protein